jgi:hypothetical protein
LAHNPALRTIVMDKFLNCSVYQFSSALGWIPELFSRAPSLTEVSFGVAIRDVEELEPEDDPIDWDALDSLFFNLRLQSLRFWVSGNAEFDDVARIITRSLPRSSERKMLRFHRGTPRLLES